MSEIQLSVVIPSVNGWCDLADCLAALERQRATAAIEVLVIDRVGEPLRRNVAVHFPAARVIAVDHATTIPRMRAIAFRAAKGTSIAVIEDHVLVPDGWARALLDAQRDGAPVVGGSVENAATERLVDWAAFLCEYSHCIPPIPAGRVDWLTGNNVIYPRDLVQRHLAVLDAGGWENLLHEALRGEGIPLTCHPEIQVLHKKHYTLGEYFSQRYLYARSYAGVRFAGVRSPKRFAYGLASLALPPVLFMRIVQRVRSKGRHQRELRRSMPLIGLFVFAWAAGEVVGYLAGPGSSLSRVR